MNVGGHTPGDNEAVHDDESLDPFATRPGGISSRPKAGALPEFIGRYRVESQVGAGSFGAVYRAIDDRLNRPVAVKVPHSHLISNAEDVEAYLSEARTVAILDHPHIVPVYDVGTDQAVECFVVSKFISGSDLSRWLTLNQPGAREIAELVLTIAEALHYAHRQGVVHRDIKPGNILIDHSGRPYVVDFGLALEVKNRGKGPEFAGTPAYMSPEQARGEGNRVDGRSDVFSLGVVLYELLCRRLPFHGNTRQELLEHILQWEAVPPRQIVDTVPKPLERICLTAIAKKASDRYSTARDLADDLRQFLSTLSLHLDSPTVPKSAVEPEPVTPTSTKVATSQEFHSTIELAALTRPLPLESADNAESTTKQKWIGGFQVIEKLGQGGMGAVYRAWHPMLRRQVALKVLLTIGNEKHEQRFAREIRALGPVRDEHLAEVFSSGSDDGIFYYAMELIEGTTLDAVCQHLQSSGSAVDQIDLSQWQAAVSTICENARSTHSEAETDTEKVKLPTAPNAQQKAIPLPKGRTYVEHVADLIRQVAGAAHKLHEVGAVHRDIKPGNIMVGLSGTKAVLIDLGLAQLADESDGKVTRTRQFVGTLRYASPEQVLAVSRIDCRSDVYSLGATLWELLTLHPMFSAGDETPTPQLMSRIQYEEPVSVRQFNRNVPKDLEAIVMKCLEKNPNARYASAQALADDLTAFLNGLTVTARPVGSVKKLGRRLQKTSRSVFVATALILATLAAFGVTQYRNYERQNALRMNKQQFNEAMNGLQLEPAKGQSILNLLTNMQATFPEEAQESRGEFESRWKAMIETQMRDQGRLDPDDIQNFQQCIQLFSEDNPVRGVLTKLLDKRLQRGSVLFDLRAPFTDFAAVFPKNAKLDESENVLRLVTEKPAYVRSKIINHSESDLELTLTASTWVDKFVGIRLDAGSGQNGNDYRLTLKGRKVEPVTKGERLRITKGDLILREREVFLKGNKLTLRVKRQGHDLHFQTNNLPLITLSDIFPVGSSNRTTSNAAFLVPSNVGIEAIKATKYLTEVQSQFELADSLYAHGNYAEAAELYDQQALTATDSISQEARYKRARCLSELKSVDEATKILRDLSIEKGSQWPALATCELCVLALTRKNFTSADEAILHLLELTPDRAIYGTLFERIDTRVLGEYSTNLSLPRQLKLDNKLVQGLCTLMILLQEHVEDLPIARQLATSKRLGEACLRTGLEAQAEKLFRAALNQRQPYESATNSTELDDSLAIFRDLMWLLIRQNRLAEAKEVIQQYENSPDLPEIFQAIMAMEFARLHAADNQLDKARSKLDAFFKLADEWENFDNCEMAEAFLLKGFLAEDEATRKQIWRDGYAQCRRPETVSDIRMSILGSVSDAMSDEDADLMINQVTGKFDSTTAPMLRTIADQIFDRRELLLALRKMWSSKRGLDYVKSHEFRTASPEQVITIQIPLSVYEICRQSAFQGNPPPEIDEMIWGTFTELVDLYRNGKLGVPGMTLLFYSWQGRFGILSGWGSVAGALPSDDLRAKLAFICGCHMKASNKPEVAKQFLGDALKYARDNENLKRIIQSYVDDPPK